MLLLAVAACVFISYSILRRSRSCFAKPTISVDLDSCSNHIYICEDCDDSDDVNVVDVSGSSSMGSWCRDLAISGGSGEVTWGRVIDEQGVVTDSKGGRVERRGQEGTGDRIRGDVG